MSRSLILIFALSCCFTPAAGQVVNLAGNWNGTATSTGPNIDNGLADASASITQTGSTLTVTIVYTTDVATIFTETGQITGTSIQINPTSDEDVSASGTITSVGMSGTGADVNDVGGETWSGSFTSDGQHITGTARGSEGDTVTWSLTRNGGTTASIRLANALSGSSQFTITPSVITSSYNFGVRSLPFVVTCVTQNTNQMVPNCDVTVSLTATLLSGGHFHPDPSFQPLRTGSLCPPNQSSCQNSQIAGNTLSNGFNVIYTAPEAAGTIEGEITGSVSGSPITSTGFTINVGVNGLKDLPPQPFYLLKGCLTGCPHPDNHFGLPAFNVAVTTLAARYAVSIRSGSVLPINDMSLVQGGIFDYQATWVPPHTLHRFGNDADIGSGDQKGIDFWVPVQDRTLLLKLIMGVGLHPIREGNCNPLVNPLSPCTHWHIRP